MRYLKQEPDGIKYEENDRYNSTNPYSATKAGGEELAVALREYISTTSLYNSHYECIWRETTPRKVYSNVYS